MMSRWMGWLLMAAVAAVPARAFADPIEVEVTFEPPVAWVDSEGYTHLEQPDCLTLGQPGAPALPVHTVQLALPAGEEVASIEITSAEPIDLGGQHVVYPAQPPRPLSWTGPVPFRQPDPDIYSSARPFPDQAGRVGPQQSLRGYSLQSIQLRPVVFEPASGRLTWIPWMVVRVHSVPQKNLADPLRARYRGLARDRALVASLVDNPGMLDAYPPAAGGSRNPDYRYVIVTSQAMSACSGNNTLQTLASDKQARGISTRIETVESIRSAYSGADDPAKIQAFIKDMYDNHGAEFVLLAGDADLSVVGGETQAPVVPVRYLWGDIGSGADQVPSDLYYAALDGNFDADGDAIYGEANDQPDLLAEVAVGRAPVDSCTELANFVRKTLAYQSASGAYLNRVYMVGEFLWGDGSSDEDWGKGYMERIRVSSIANGLDTKGFSELPFFATQTMYDRDLGGDGSWDASEILGVINGQQHIINHLGHSYTNYNMRMTSDDIIAGMTNSQGFFEYSQGCYCGSFDNRLDEQMDKQTYWQDSFAEHMTVDAKGAFAVVMNTRYGLGGYSNYFHRLFWDDLFRNGQDRLGPMNNYSKNQLSGYVATDTGMRWVYYEATLFGDPEVAIHSSAATGDPVIGLPDESPWFLAILGVDDPEPQTLQLRNDGGGTLNWQVSGGAAWLQVSPQSGTAPSDIGLSADISGLAAGAYQANLTFTAPEASNSPVQMPVDLYVIEVPTAVAPYSAAAAPVVDGTIGAGEYPGATLLEMGTFDGSAASARVLHNGSLLNFALEIDGDVDVDPEDVALLVVDTNGDGLWPTDPASTDEGEFDLWANGDLIYWPYFNDGSGQQTGQGEYTAGVQASFGMNAGHRVAELSFDLSTSRLQRQMGETFRLFLYYLDYNAVTGQHEVVAIWPFAVRSFDDARYLASVTIGTDTDNLMAQPDSLMFQATEGLGPTDHQLMTLSSTTANSLSFSVSPSQTWLHVATASGTTPAAIEVWADPAGLSVGPHSANLNITAAGASNSPLAVPVTLQVAQAPAVIAVDPVFLSFSYTQGNSPPGAQSLHITNQGGGTLTFTASAVGDWVHLSQTSGTAPATIQVTPLVQGLEPGYNAGAVLLEAPGITPMRVELGIEVRAQPHVLVNPTAIEKYDATAGGPVEVEFYISNEQWGTMDWTVAESASWMSLQPTSGTYVSGHPSLVKATLDPTGLSAGVQEADILIVASGADNSPRSLHVSWTLSEGPAIGVSPDALEFHGVQGGPNPAPQILQINNLSQGGLDFSLVCQPAWLTCNPLTGSAPGSITVTADLSGLSVGQHTGSITISSDQAANSPVTVNASGWVESAEQNNPPPAPVLIGPAHLSDVFTANPQLTLQNVADPDGDAVTYDFEVYAHGQDIAWTVIADVPPGATNTSVTVSKTLEVDTTYEWRARAVDSQGLAGAWSDRWMFSVHAAQNDTGGGCGCGTGAGGRPAGLGLLILLLGLARLPVRGRRARSGSARRG